MNTISAKQRLSPQSWDDDDDKLLVRLKEVEHLGWKQIAKYFNNRTSNACQFRWRRLKSGQLKKVYKHRKSYPEIEQHAADRMDEKFNENLISDKIITNTKLAGKSTKNGLGWTVDEDNLICSRDAKNLSIVELSILLPNKSTNNIENRIQFLERKKVSIDSLLTHDSDHSNLRAASPTCSTASSSVSSTPISTSILNYSTCSSSINVGSGIQHHPNKISHFPIYQTTTTVLPPIKNLLNNQFPSSSSYHNTNNNNVKLPSLSQVYSYINQ